jgi:selenocysteine lyase/cysteine desulfurase
MDPTDFRARVPALDDCIYLNTGAASPSPVGVIDAVESCLERHERVAPAGEGMYAAAEGVFEDARAAVAGLLGARPDEIALTESTADGVSRIADAIDWEEGDMICRTDCEHPAGVLPWRRLMDTEGIEVREIETNHGRLDLDAFAEAVSDARLVCTSSIAWNYGTRFPIEEMAELAHDAGAQVLVDAVQSPGQVDIDVTEWNADFVAGAGHKWLCGPWGAGFLYVADDAAETLEPDRMSYRSVVDPSAADYELHPSAARLEIGTLSPAPYAGLRAAIGGIEDVGLERVEAHVEALTDRLKEGLGERLLSPREYESGLVTFAADDPDATVTRLDEEGIKIRSIPDPDALRASVHVFNDEADVDALLAAL